MNYEILPFYEACFNGVSLCFMFLGLWAIKSQKRNLHVTMMLSAVVASTIFLALYLLYHFNVPSKSYTGDLAYIYYPILISHILLAALVPFLVGYVLFLGFKSNFATHKKWAKWTFPIWAYVSFTGIIVYLMVH